MDLNYGVNGSVGVEAARPIVVDSKTPIGIVVPYGAHDEMKAFANAAAFKTWLDTEGVDHSTLAWRTADSIDLQGVSCQLAVVLVPDSADPKQALLDGMDTLKMAPQKEDVLIRPNLIIVPEHSSDLEIAAKIDAIAATFHGTGIIDVPGGDEAAVKAFGNNFGSRFLLLVGGKAKVSGALYPVSALVAGHIAYWDAGGDNGAKPYGWAESHSNRVVKAVAGMERPVEYFDGGDCEARRLRQDGIASIVQDIGWRFHGFETTAIDPIWESLERVRTFYRVLRAVVEASKWARDRGANELVYVRDSVDQLMREMRGNKVALGFEIYFDTEKNTLATVTAGKFYLTVKWENMPTVRELNIEMIYTDQYGEMLINFLNGGN